MAAYEGTLEGSRIAGTRMVAQIIDGALITAYAFVLYWVIGIGEEYPATLADSLEAWVIDLVLLSVPNFLYFVLLEGSMSGATVGKRLMSLQVLGGMDGAFRRNLFRFGLAELLTIGIYFDDGTGTFSMVGMGLVLLMWIWFVIGLYSSDGRTAYDRWAGTKVIKG